LLDCAPLDRESRPVGPGPRPAAQGGRLFDQSGGATAPPPDHGDATFCFLDPPIVDQGPTGRMQGVKVTHVMWFHVFTTGFALVFTGLSPRGVVCRGVRAPRGIGISGTALDRMDSKARAGGVRGP
jgi:hypothetical protein